MRRTSDDEANVSPTLHTVRGIRCIVAVCAKHESKSSEIQNCTSCSKRITPAAQQPVNWLDWCRARGEMSPGASSTSKNCSASVQKLLHCMSGQHSKSPSVVLCGTLNPINNMKPPSHLSVSAGSSVCALNKKKQVTEITGWDVQPGLRWEWEDE